MELTETPPALVKKTAAAKMQAMQRTKVTDEWARRGITYGSQGIDWISVTKILNHKTIDGGKKTALFQIISYVTPTRDRLARQGRNVDHRRGCGQLDTIDHCLIGCDHHPVQDPPEM